MGCTSGELTDPEVLVEEKSCVRILTLNRPKQLNALSVAMASRLLELFLSCEEDSCVKLIILKGKGRAFCAGGDAAVIARDINQGNWKSGANKFRRHLTLDYVIATYSKSQVSILNGIVMGEELVFLYMADSELLQRIRFLLCLKQRWDFFQMQVHLTFCQDSLDFFGNFFLSNVRKFVRYTDFWVKNSTK